MASAISIFCPFEQEVHEKKEAAPSPPYSFAFPPGSRGAIRRQTWQIAYAIIVGGWVMLCSSAAMNQNWAEVTCPVWIGWNRRDVVKTLTFYSRDTDDVHLTSVSRLVWASFTLMIVGAAAVLATAVVCCVVIGIPDRFSNVGFLVLLCAGVLSLISAVIAHEEIGVIKSALHSQGCSSGDWLDGMVFAFLAPLSAILAAPVQYFLNWLTSRPSP